jgi:hypothetical protein
MLDGLGFRFYWATEGMEEDGFTFSPAPERWSILETVNHIWGLMNWIHGSLFEGEQERPSSGAATVGSILEMIRRLRNRFEGMTDSDLKAYRLNDRPFWNLINGPIEDAVYHSGQIETLRRIGGFPPKDPQYFTGEPPRQAGGMQC